MKETMKADRSTGVQASLFARLVATSFGLGYIPLMPGTFGSLAGVGVYALCIRAAEETGIAGSSRWAGIYLAAAAAAIISVVGVWAAGCEEKAGGKKDPSHVVVDEVSGQLITFVAALAPLNWKYCLGGFILFRAFDIAKPYPIRRAESLPGGWGIMADDWLAGLLAALGLWILRWRGM